MEPNYLNDHTKAGTVGGVLLVLLFKPGFEDILVSAVLSAVGATVSFGVSIFLKFIFKRLNRK